VETGANKRVFILRILQQKACLNPSKIGVKADLYSAYRQ